MSASYFTFVTSFLRIQMNWSELILDDSWGANGKYCSEMSPWRPSLRRLAKSNCCSSLPTEASWCSPFPKVIPTYFKLDKCTIQQWSSHIWTSTNNPKASAAFRSISSTSGPWPKQLKHLTTRNCQRLYRKLLNFKGGVELPFWKKLLLSPWSSSWPCTGQQFCHIVDVNDISWGFLTRRWKLDHDSINLI